MSKRKLYLLSVLSGIIFFLSWPPYGLPLLLFVAFIPLLIIEKEISSEGYKGKRTLLFGLSFLAFFIWNITTTYWVYNASAGGAAMAILSNTFIMAAVMWTFHIVKSRLSPTYITSHSAKWLFPIFWLAYEFFHHSWELTWPWLGLGNAFASMPSFIQWYEYTGTCGGSLWVLALNLSIFDLIKFDSNKITTNKKSANKILLVATAIFLPIIFSLSLYYTYDEKQNPVNIVVVQPNIDPYSEKFSGLNFEEQLEKMLTLAESQVDSTTEYLVFPETALTESIWENDLPLTSSVHHLRMFIKKFPKLNIVVGAATWYLYEKGEKLSETARKFTRQDGYYDAFNTAIHLDSSNTIQTYHKSKLVPGVERMPYPFLFGFLESLTIDLGGTAGSLGTQEERTVFHPTPALPEGEGGSTQKEQRSRVAPVICYESIFGEFVTEYINKGANVIFIITNDGWWGNTSGFKQHLEYGALRAIETRRSIARSANTGISCFVNQRGDILQQTGWWVPAAIKGTINKNSTETFYVKHGDIIWRVCFYVSIFILLFSGTLNLLRKKVRP